MHGTRAIQRSSQPGHRRNSWAGPRQLRNGISFSMLLSSRFLSLNLDSDSVPAAPVDRQREYSQSHRGKVEIEFSLSRLAHRDRGSHPVDNNLLATPTNHRTADIHFTSSKTSTCRYSRAKTGTDSTKPLGSLGRAADTRGKAPSCQLDSVPSLHAFMLAVYCSQVIEIITHAPKSPATDACSKSLIQFMSFPPQYLLTWWALLFHPGSDLRPDR